MKLVNGNLTAEAVYRAQFLAAEYRYHEAIDAREDALMYEQDFAETVSAEEWIMANEWRMGSELQ